jgi:hypothetical protein
MNVGPARRVQYQQLGLPIENSIHVCVLVHGCSRRVPTDKSGFPVKCVFAIKGSDLGKTSFGDGASLLGSLDAAVNADVIVLDWGLPKISGIDLLVNSPGLAQFLAAHATLGRNAD